MAALSHDDEDELVHNDDWLLCIIVMCTTFVALEANLAAGWLYLEKLLNTINGRRQRHRARRAVQSSATNIRGPATDESASSNAASQERTLSSL